MADYTLVLGNRNYSSWSMRGWLAVHQAGLDAEEVVIPLDTPATAAEIARYSPSGLVPALVGDGEVVWDSLAIAETAAERAPSAGLWPAEPAARALARAVVAEMHSGYRALRAELPMNIRADKPGRTWSDAAAADIARVQELWRDCRARFGDAGAFLFGAWTLADAFYAPVVTRFHTYGVTVDEAAADYMAAVRSWPAVVAWSEAAAAEPWSVAKYDAL